MVELLDTTLEFVATIEEVEELVVAVELEIEDDELLLVGGATEVVIPVDLDEPSAK